MLTTQLLFGIITFIIIASDHAYAQKGTKEHQGPQTCGGDLKGPVGTITTPNFPSPFPVPIKCKWIIQHDIVNGTISIYFTQQYTTSGLTFTEYMYYDESYKLGERRALTVTEENITRIKWLQVQSPVLVVELNLNQLEGTQLRALGLLSVFGFNLTYTVRGPTKLTEPTSCSAIECRLLGHCYARQDYQEFYCSCFEGYSGADCGKGPLCSSSSNMCKNGGTCRQMGPAAVSCICAHGYMGDLCESQIATPECGIEECAEVCKEGSDCDCNPKDTDLSSARFDTGLQVVDQPSVNITEEIKKEVTSYLKASNVTLEDEIEILNISSLEANGARTVWLRVWGARREAGMLRAAMARLIATRTRTDRLHLLPTTLSFNMQPALSLRALVVNQRPEVWEGSEFILTCMAYGSQNIAFTWYKDGIKINFNGTTRDIWTRTVSEDALGRRMSMLGVSEANRLDSGKWACAAEDAGRRRCRALRLAVLRPPDIRLVPSTLTVKKGDNVSITCLAGAGRVHGALGFSWARERTLLPMTPGRQVWEDLYPAGSVLKLYNVQKSSKFCCQVSSVAGTNSKGVTMWALGDNDEACESDALLGIRWPQTAPGAYASVSCPSGYSGETTRFCESKIGQHGVKWILPDFSGCIADSLKYIYDQFKRISYGYSWENVSDLSRQYGIVLRSLLAHPGGGEPSLRHSIHMLQYLMSSAAQPADRYHSTDYLLKIYDNLLKYPDAFLDEEKIFDLQNAVMDTAGMQRNFDKRYHEFTVKTKSVRVEHSAHFEFLPTPAKVEEWVLTSADVDLLAETGNASVVTTFYHNLEARLPSLRRSIELKSGSEMEFVVASQQVQVSAIGTRIDASLHTVTLLFVHANNYSTTASKLACGVRTASEPRTWTTMGCEVWLPQPAHVACRCRGLGTIVLFTIARTTLTDGEKDLQDVVKITVSLGGAICLATALLQLLCLAPGGKATLSVLLKAATAGIHATAMLALLECDTRQDEACPGIVGWVCATCWCAGCAALCAQPLLLHAELTGRAQHAPSVALLAGICTLSWLTALVWGGSPLQLGTAAAGVWSAGAVLINGLTLVLALCAARILRTVTNKLPLDRRSYARKQARDVRHTLVLLFSSSLAQAAGVMYAQPGETHTSHVVALSIAALANGIAMLICYVCLDEDCLQAARGLLTLSSNRAWQESPAGDTSLSLYIKQDCEMESGGDVVTQWSCSSPGPRASSYWQPQLALSPARMHSISRSQSNLDCRADIVQCVEYRNSMLIPHQYETHAVCDLILAGVEGGGASVHENSTRINLEEGMLHSPSTVRAPGPILDKRFDTPKESCSIYMQSNPDISNMPDISKSCLKKSKSQFKSSTSLPSINHVHRDESTKSHIEQVNREWNEAYDSPDSDKMLSKISNDLDFLLNRMQSKKDRIEDSSTHLVVNAKNSFK